MMYLHCGKCSGERPPTGVSRREHARLSVGVDDTGITVKCVRCGLEILHLDPAGLAALMDRVSSGECSCEDCKRERARALLMGKLS